MWILSDYLHFLFLLFFSPCLFSEESLHKSEQLHGQNHISNKMSLPTTVPNVYETLIRTYIHHKDRQQVQFQMNLIYRKPVLELRAVFVAFLLTSVVPSHHPILCCTKLPSAEIMCQLNKGTTGNVQRLVLSVRVPGLYMLIL